MPNAKLLVSEGHGDAAFLDELIRVRGLKDFVVHKRPNEMPAGSGSFERILKSIVPAREYDDISLIVVIADNDSDPEASFDSVVKQIKRAEEYAVPKRPREVASGENVRSVSVLMLPWDDVEGDLETVYYDIASLQRPELAECTDAFIGLLKQQVPAMVR